MRRQGGDRRNMSFNHRLMSEVQKVKMQATKEKAKEKNRKKLRTNTKTGKKIRRHRQQSWVTEENQGLGSRHRNGGDTG